jgi:phosphatidylserine decarboxylase
MRIPLTKYGWPQVAIFPAGLLAVMVCCPLIGVLFLPAWAVISVEVVLAAILIWILSFFRDPYRVSPSDESLLLAPADGRITDIEIIEQESFVGGAALRIGIFLNIFNAHINRAPCSVRVEKIAYRKGKHKNAANHQAGRVNESNDLVLVRTDNPRDKLIVRQISGAIARRIICKTSQGQELTSGEKFGMIKFGSRTELYVPLNTDIRNNVWEPKCLVKIGDKVRAGLTPLIRYEIQKDKEDAQIKDPGS